MKRIIASTVAVGAILGGMLVASAPAQAALMGCATSTVCVYDGPYRAGLNNSFSGFTSMHNLGALKDKASSWTNANNSQAQYLGEYQGSRPVVLQYLYAGWYEDNIAVSVAGWADNSADYLAWY